MKFDINIFKNVKYLRIFEMIFQVDNKYNYNFNFIQKNKRIRWEIVVLQILMRNKWNLIDKKQSYKDNKWQLISSR